MATDLKVIVSADALYRLLMAVGGPGHYIRELQATRGLPGVDDNPIDVLTREYNEFVERVNNPPPSPCPDCDADQVCLHNPCRKRS